MPPAQSLFCPDPYITVPILEKALNVEVGQAVFDAVALYALCRDRVKPSIGSYPYFSTAALEKAPNEVSDGIMVRSLREMRRGAFSEMIDTVSICADPGRAISCAIHAANGYVSQARKLQGHCNSVRYSESCLSDHPNVTVRRTGYGAIVAVGARQGNETNLGFF